MGTIPSPILHSTTRGPWISIAPAWFVSWSRYSRPLPPSILTTTVLWAQLSHSGFCQPVGGGGWCGSLLWHLYGCFLKWWYPTTMGFPTKKWLTMGCFGGYHHFRKPPYRCDIFMIWYHLIYLVLITGCWNQMRVHSYCLYLFKNCSCFDQWLYIYLNILCV